MAKRIWTQDDARNEDFVTYSKIKDVISAKNQNKPFLYPGPHHRLTEPNGRYTEAKMQRGFMRSIIFGLGNSTNLTQNKDSQNIKLNFQFNPEYIQRDVTQSQGAVNPLLQNPANLTQPVPGTAMFNFTMTFNREQEVAMYGEARREQEALGLSGDDISYAAIKGALSDPGRVGVMHDLVIFDKIIGQGISDEIVDAVSSYATQVAKLKKPDEDDEGTATTVDEEAIKNTLNANFGNSAFINPMPVRVVFGDLFMVEGFVIGSAVAFQKFSRRMVPTICQINCNIQAMYFGFAKKKAFVTDNLQAWFKSELEQDEQNKKDTIIAEQVVLNMLQRFQYVFNSSTEGLLNEDDYNLDLPNANSDGMKIWRGTSVGQYYSGNNSGFMTLPQWFNAFSNDKIDVPGNKAKEIYEVFTAGQRVDRNNSTLSSDYVGWLPLLVVIDIMNPYKEGSTTTRMAYSDMPDTLDKLGIKVLLPANVYVRTSRGDTKTSKTVAVKAFGGNTVGGGGGNSEGWRAWNKVGDNSHSFTVLNQWYGIKKPASNNITQYFRVFWLNPSDVSDKEALNHTDDCEIVFNWTIQKDIASATGKVSLREQSIFYKFNEPFISNNASNQRKESEAKPIKKTSSGGGGGGGTSN